MCHATGECDPDRERTDRGRDIHLQRDPRHSMVSPSTPSSRDSEWWGAKSRVTTRPCRSARERITVTTSAATTNAVATARIPAPITSDESAGS